MKITVIQGTEIKGCTWQMKRILLEELSPGNEVREFVLPRDLPHFCRGCKCCFLQSEHKCPHASQVEPIWQAMLAADLLVFVTPVYSLRAPAQVHTLLDHLCCHWMVHRPEEAMFHKRCLLLTQSVGGPNGGAQKDIATSLTWMGVSDIRKLGFGLMHGIVWSELPEKKRSDMEKRIRKFAKNCRLPLKKRRSVKIRLIWAMCKITHKAALKNEEIPSADNQHWLDKGWL